MKPMLAKTVDTRRLLDLIRSDEWAAEQKLDGHRALINLTNGQAYTRTGQAFNALRDYANLLTELHHLTGEGGAWLDGEYLPEQNELWLFDFVVEGKSFTYDQRRRMLVERFDGTGLVVPHYISWQSKANLCQVLLETHREGIMLKRRNAPYRSERSGHWLKYKFVSTADCVVTRLGVDGRANMELSLHFDGKLLPVAECSALTGDGPSVSVGDVVEVSYLYTTPDHRLYQPVKPMLRTDKHPSECTSDQLIYANRTVLQTDL